MVSSLRVTNQHASHALQENERYTFDTYTYGDPLKVDIYSSVYMLDP